jgi:RNA polymerase sigma factor for flagellar operon FliA
MREGRDAQDHEIAAELNISIDEYFGLLKDTQGSRLFSFEELVENSNSEHKEPRPELADGEAPLIGLENDQMNDQLVDAMKALPEREQIVIALYYEEELNLKEIGAVIGVSESRVSQIHSQATMRLRSKMRDWT